MMALFEKFCAAFVLLMQVMPILTQDCELPGITTLPPTKLRPTTPRDLLFVLDESGSISQENFDMMLNFTQSLVARFPNVGHSRGTNVGLVTFSTDTMIQFNLTTYNTLIGTLNAIGAIKNRGGITNTHLALDSITEMLKGGRPDAKKLGILLTDGKATNPALATVAAHKLKSSGLNILSVVGIGSTVDHEALKKLATRVDLYFKVSGFSKLKNIFKDLLGAVCDHPDKEVCKRCEYENGIYLFADLKNCSKYQQCIAAGQVLVPSRPCPFGQFWDNTAITCRLAGAVNCDKDPCISGVLPNYAYDSICSAYWVCKDNKTVGAECCDSGFGYLQGTGCVPNAKCTDECEPEEKPDVCDLKPHPSDPTKYLQHLGGSAWKTMDCSVGTEFDETDCRCSIYGKIPAKTGCNHILYIPFDKNVQDVNRRVYVRNSKPKVKAGRKIHTPGTIGRGAGKFNGKSRLYVPRFTNTFFGDKLVIRVRFLETSRTVPIPSGQLETIFGNGDCKKDGSIAVKYNRTSNEVIAKLVTLDVSGKKVTTTATVSVGAGNWKDVEYRYDGATLKLTVDGVTDTQLADGNIAQTRAALQIGSGCSKDDNYEGYEDEFYVFPCLP